MTAPWLSNTYDVPLTSGSQRVFSAGWYLQEGPVQPAPIVFTARVFRLGKLEGHDPTTLSQGDFLFPFFFFPQRLGWVCFLTLREPLV